MNGSKKTIFTGVATALVTPFSGGEVDYAALERLIEQQIAAGVPAIVIGGTTGEAATLSDSERYELFRFAGERIRGRAVLVLGTGTNDTRVAINHTKQAEELGCDGALLVTPYYNKGTEEGVYRHYMAVANATSLPLILYNVPSRTGVNLGINLLRRLAEHERIVAIKEAGDSLDRLVALAELTDRLTLYSGNDSQIYPTLALGGAGVISVVSNIFPRECCDICRLYSEGRYKESLAIQHRLMPLISALFTETNPAPVKYAMSRLGLIGEELRLPLAPVRESTRRMIDEALEGL